MTEAYSWLKLLHILSATVLFGTGLGTAFHMWMAHLGGDTRSIAVVSRSVVIADYAFTTPAVIAQPATGLALIWLVGFDPFSSWLVAVYALYGLTGACWLPVVWLQIRVRDMAASAAATGDPLPAAYGRCMKLWFGFGCCAFAAVIAIFWLMVNKPDLW
jgi:uncharacterized membrane protein